MGGLILLTCLQNYKKVKMLGDEYDNKCYKSEGEVGKTISIFNIAGNLASHGYKVLQIDIDPQASLTIFNGIELE